MKKLRGRSCRSANRPSKLSQYQAPYSIEQMRQILEFAYNFVVENLSADLPQSRNEISELQELLADVYYCGSVSDSPDESKIDKNLLRPDCELTEEEVYRRVALATGRRLLGMKQGQTLHPTADLALLDALKDLVTYGERQDWTITRECEIVFE